ncbi:hypothetical protein M0R45_005274 [Rubus argutus]|uniref:DUF4283 domain-containing protein n=1 Tax=Rubus argutus TaxID=59490 RepID=A0AAW1YM50_RUBAR
MMTQAPPPQTTPSFSSIVGDAVAAENPLPIPKVHGDKIFVKISEDLYEEQLKLFRTNLIGRLLLRKGSIPLWTDTIKISLDALWKPSKSWHLVLLGRDFFDIHFDSEADMKRIWNGGTCVLNNGIASGIGTPLQIDKATKERQFGYYACILVDIDLSKNHPTSLMVERETENKFDVLASEPCKDHSHVITEPITVPLDNIGKVATTINVLQSMSPLTLWLQMILLVLLL